MRAMAANLEAVLAPKLVILLLTFSPLVDHFCRQASGRGHPLTHTSELNRVSQALAPACLHRSVSTFSTEYATGAYYPVYESFL